MLKIKVKDQTIAGYASNAVSEYQAFVGGGNDVLQIVGPTESTFLLGNFNAHIRTDSETRKGVIGRREDPAFYENGRYLLQLYGSSVLCISVLEK